jgi:hypothetical protein
MNQSSSSRPSWRELLTVGFCCMMVFLTFTWNLPPSALRTKITNVTQEIVVPLGLWQEWNMFTSPQTKGYAVSVVLITRTGVTSIRPEFFSDKGVSAFPSPSTNLYYNLVYDAGNVYRLNYLSYFCHQDPNLGSAILQVADLPTPNVLDGASTARIAPKYVSAYTVKCS